MTARQACEHTSKAYFLVLLSSLAIPSAPSLAQGAHHVHVQQPSGVRKACQPLEFETRKHRQERDQLGPAHAAEHARMRAAQCEVERGVRKVPAAGKVVSAAKSLKDDADIRAAVIARAAGQIQGSALATGPAVAPTATLAATAPDPLTFGRWSDPFVIPVVGVAAVLLHTGKVLFWSYDPVDYHNPDNSGNGVGFVWDYTTRTGHNIPPPENIWCAAQTILADGRVYVAGGNLRYPDPSAPAGTSAWQGSLSNYTFNPYTELWARQPDMVRGRWYPTVTQLADNRVVITSGMDETGSGAITNDVEVFTPAANIAGVGTIKAVGTHNPSGLYPLQFLLPSGQVQEAGPNAASSFKLNPLTWNWSTVPVMRSDHYYLGNGVSYTDVSAGAPRQVIMVAGGHTEKTALAANEWLDGFNPDAGWKDYPLWKVPRHNANTVILPDGKLLTVGGNRGLYGYELPEFSAELYSQAADNLTGTWQPMAPHQIQAAYHSTALLLPDATVLLSQDDMDYSAQAAFAHKVQIYSPPYLFKGAQPQITAAPATATYGQSLLVSTDRQVVSAMLVAPGATTHGNDMHQRAIKLKMVNRTGGLTATVPQSRGVVPPGYYMLFVVDAAGIPSVARFINIS